MQKSFLPILSILLFLPSISAAETPKHLFILSGQSNMAGLDPNVSFKPTVEAAFGKDNVAVVKDAQSAEPIMRWYKEWTNAQGEKPQNTGDLYDRLMQKVDAVVKTEDFSTVTFVWMQGERDARKKHGEVYAESLQGLIRQLENDLGRNDVNFVIGRLSDFDTEPENYPHWTIVRNAQVEVAEAHPRGAWIDTDDLNGEKNDLHYSDEGYEILGRRFAEKAIDLINKNPSPQAGELQ